MAKVLDATKHYIALQIEDFMQEIQDDRQPFVTGQDGRAVVELFSAIYKYTLNDQILRRTIGDS